MNHPENNSARSPESNPRPAGLFWILLLACLLGPAILTSLAALADRSSRGPAPGIAVLGGLVGGIGFGILLGRRLGRTPGWRIVLGLILAATGVVACITIATIGCLASGYHLDFR